MEKKKKLPDQSVAVQETFFFNAKTKYWSDNGTILWNDWENVSLLCTKQQGSNIKLIDFVPKNRPMSTNPENSFNLPRGMLTQSQSLFCVPEFIKRGQKCWNWYLVSHLAQSFVSTFLWAKKLLFHTDASMSNWSLLKKAAWEMH